MFNATRIGFTVIRTVKLLDTGEIISRAGDLIVEIILSRLWPCLNVFPRLRVSFVFLGDSFPLFLLSLSLSLSFSLFLFPFSPPPLFLPSFPLVVTFSATVERIRLVHGYYYLRELVNCVWNICRWMNIARWVMCGVFNWLMVVPNDQFKL